MPKRFALYPEEVEMFNEFKKTHSCDPAKREAMVEECVSPILTSILLSESGIGINVHAKCEVCGTSQVIMCEERFNSI